MKLRTDVLNHLAEKYQLKRYLEIGVQNSAQNFDKIKCEYKVSVDPDPNVNVSFCMTSDQFFEMFIRRGEEMYTHEIFEKNKFDLIFIDGLHTAEQVKKDFENALKVLATNGFICIHDCNPEKEEHTIVPRPTKTGHWNGSVYKFAAGLMYPKYTVDVDNGCTIVGSEKNSFPYERHEVRPITWKKFNANRKELLNLISWDEFIKL